MRFTDNGIGMSEETIQKIFQPFYTTKDPNKGTGLGMSLSFDIIQQHAGEISVESKVGEGSTLTVSIPHDPAMTIALAEDTPDEDDDEE